MGQRPRLYRVGIHSGPRLPVTWEEVGWKHHGTLGAALPASPTSGNRDLKARTPHGTDQAWVDDKEPRMKEMSTVVFFHFPGLLRFCVQPQKEAKNPKQTIKNHKPSPGTWWGFPGCSPTISRSGPLSPALWSGQEEAKHGEEGEGPPAPAGTAHHSSQVRQPREPL